MASRHPKQAPIPDWVLIVHLTASRASFSELCGSDIVDAVRCLTYLSEDDPDQLEEEHALSTQSKFDEALVKYTEAIGLDDSNASLWHPPTFVKGLNPLSMLIYVLAAAGGVAISAAIFTARNQDSRGGLLTLIFAL
ncbi:uncharacterized protein EV420DRAFT_1633499 [Desarmillaria tabescens]|uniref:Uncharacterized protein n=1 Tax=Armillaria tabescens TaxID=1929756 RepID=A0AA39NNT7_ARMTA|nr:uncharacterized protein EV420DRAFT_1633499 [Desarmillaria tabescens]KAK0469066.1 hypothetical protein EV420DRAFT_1633499 [Desarmillaria tabescens]